MWKDRGREGGRGEGGGPAGQQTGKSCRPSVALPWKAVRQESGSTRRGGPFLELSETRRSGEGSQRPAQLQRVGFGPTGPWCRLRPMPNAPHCTRAWRVCLGPARVAGKELLTKCHFWRGGAGGKGPLRCLRREGGSEQGQTPRGSLQGRRPLAASPSSQLRQTARTPAAHGCFLPGKGSVQAPALSDLAGTPTPRCPGLSGVPEPSSWTETCAQRPGQGQNRRGRGVPGPCPCGVWGCCTPRQDGLVRGTRPRPMALAASGERAVGPLPASAPRGPGITPGVLGPPRLTPSPSRRSLPCRALGHRRWTGIRTWSSLTSAPSSLLPRGDFLRSGFSSGAWGE